MTLQDVLDLAKNGELSNLAVKDDIDAVVGYLNLGIIELYKRFPIATKEYIIELDDGVELYKMPSDFMWLVAAYGEVPEDSTATTLPIPVNEEDNPLSVNTVSWDTLQVPLAQTGAYISIIYVSSPPVFTSNDLAEEVPLPLQMIEALLHYTGYRAHGAMNGEVQAENNTHYQRFELSCQRIKTEGMFTSDDLFMNSRLSSRGFV